jgi:adenylate cyclase
MAANPSRLSQFWKELKRRKVIRVITVYAAATFAIIDLLSNIIEPLRLPEWTLPFVIVLLCIGFIIAVILSWIFDRQPGEGLVKTKPVNQAEPDHLLKASNGWKIASYVSFVVILGLLVLNIIPDSSQSTNESIIDKSIAVLPFEDMSVNQDQEYFCDGIAEEIINSLTQLDSLKVIARTSTFAFKNRQEDIREIGKILGVGTVLEGSVQKAGNRLRITAQLINVEDGSHLWSERFDREMEDIFIIQDEISEAIVDKLSIKLLGKRGEIAGQRQTGNPEAYNLYLKGRFFWHRRTVEDMLKSVQNFEQAVALDTTYALAYAGLADAYFIMTWWEYIPREEGFEKAKAYANMALTINHVLPEAHATMGGILTWYDWDWKGAEKELLYAISLNPNDANAYQYLSELMNVLGKNKEAHTYIDQALNLNPHSHIMYNIKASYYYDEGNYEKAIEECKKSMEIFQFGFPLIKLFKCNIRLGHDQEAVEIFKKIISIDPSFDRSEVIDAVYRKSGIEGLIKRYIQWLQENDSPDFFYKVSLNITIAELYGLLGDSEQAMSSLKKAFDAHESDLPSINNNRDFVFLRDDPRFQAMLHKMNL